MRRVRCSSASSLRGRSPSRTASRRSIVDTTCRSTMRSPSKPRTSACCRRPTTRPKGCAPSSRSARRSSSVGEPRRLEREVAMTRESARVVLNTLSLRDFRNLGRLDLGFPGAGAVVIGENGQGKSNLLEAIYYLHLLRSVRGARDVDVVRFGAAGFHIAARAEGGVHRELSAGFERGGRRKRVKVDGVEPPRL